MRGEKKDISAQTQIKIYKQIISIVLYTFNNQGVGVG